MHYHTLWKWYEMKREERRLCCNLNQIGDTWREMERRQDRLAEHQLRLTEFERYHRRALNLRRHEK